MQQKTSNVKKTLTGNSERDKTNYNRDTRLVLCRGKGHSAAWMIKYDKNGVPKMPYHLSGDLLFPSFRGSPNVETPDLSAEKPFPEELYYYLFGDPHIYHGEAFSKQTGHLLLLRHFCFMTWAK